MYQPGALKSKPACMAGWSTKRAIHPVAGSEMHSSKRSVRPRMSIAWKAHVGAWLQVDHGVQAGRSRSSGMINCFNLKGTIEDQSSIPLYWAQPWSSDFLHALRKLLLMRLHLDGS